MRTDDDPESYLDEPPSHGPEDIPDDDTLHCDNCPVDSDQTTLYHVDLAGDTRAMLCDPCRHAVALRNADLLTDSQAFAYVYRDVHGLSRKETAERYGHSPNVHDDAILAARRKVRKARDTVAVLDAIHDAVDGELEADQ